jgi:hypothetical protein
VSSCASEIPTRPLSFMKLKLVSRCFREEEIGVFGENRGVRVVMFSFEEMFRVVIEVERERVWIEEFSSLLAERSRDWRLVRRWIEFGFR